MTRGAGVHITGPPSICRVRRKHVAIGVKGSVHLCELRPAQLPLMRSSHRQLLAYNDVAAANATKRRTAQHAAAAARHTT